jgi:uncharacterized protein YcbX
MNVASLWIYPIKSCAGVPVGRAVAGPHGFVGDRRWMVTDPDGTFLTQRDTPPLARVRVSGCGGSADGALTLDADGLPPLVLAPPDGPGPRLSVRVWGDAVDARRGPPEAEAWFSAVIGRDARLVYFDEAARRPVDPAYARAGDEVAFADGFPYLLVGDGALVALNERLVAAGEPPVPMARFRPNVVLGGVAPHAEDGWPGVRVGSVRFALPKACGRCSMTTLDPETLTFSAEPLRTLARYRRDPRPGRGGVLFGMNAIARDVGTIAVGDPVVPLDAPPS